MAHLFGVALGASIAVESRYLEQKRILSAALSAADADARRGLLKYEMRHSFNLQSRIVCIKVAYFGYNTC